MLRTILTLVMVSQMRLILKPFALGTLAMVVGTACAPGDDGGSGSLNVVATTSILGDVVARVVEDAGEVDVLLPRGADPHAFDPAPRDVADAMAADLLVVNGLGLEEGLEDAIGAAGDAGVEIFEVAVAADPIPPDGGGEDLDPHVWFDPLRMADAIRQLGARLEDLASDLDWSERADRYARELTALHEEISGLVETIPTERRILVTNHDVLGYFAARYGFEVVGTVVPGSDTLGEPSARQMEQLADTVAEEGVPAIFADVTAPARLARTLAEEVGEEVEVVELFTESLGEEGSGAETYVEMMRINARRIVEALA